MKRTAFTMIELIFVIVILGLLAGIAIPKLMATKDDARIVSEISSVKQIIQNASAEFLSQGSYSTYEDLDCYSFTTSNDGNFTVSLKNVSFPICQKIHSSVLSKDLNQTYQNGGTRIVW